MAEVDLTFDREAEANKVKAEVLRKAIEGEESDWFKPLSPTEKVLQGLFLGLGAVDWGQTVNFTQHPDKNGFIRTEANPLVGSRPSRAKVNVMIPLGLALHTGAVYALPRPYRNIVQGLGLLGEGLAVGSNFKHGIKPVWPWK